MALPTDIVLLGVTAATAFQPTVRELWRTIFKRPSKSTLVVRQGDDVVTIEYDDTLSESERERLFGEAIEQIRLANEGTGEARDSTP